MSKPRNKLTRRGISLLENSIEVLKRMTPGNVAHHRANAEMMLYAVLSEAKGRGLFDPPEKRIELANTR
jgi:CBS domain containing-hemolysin-like protein